MSSYLSAIFIICYVLLHQFWRLGSIFIKRVDKENQGNYVQIYMINMILIKIMGLFPYGLIQLPISVVFVSFPQDQNVAFLALLLRIWV